MVRLNVIYTRTGDAGESGLGDGTRRPKTDARFVAMGDVDETNCAIGVARLHTRDASDSALAAVGATLRVVRLNSRMPSRASSSDTTWLSAVLESPTSAAAPRKLRRCATATTASSSIRRPRLIVPFFASAHTK